MPTSKPVPAKIAARLRAKVSALDDAEAATSTARRELDDALWAAVTVGDCQVSAVALAAGTSRETVYHALRRADPQLRIS
jgi:transcriptional regulator of acetoin/glycerol metabolism